jgi:6-methylsalicylate decarboxylase
MSTPQNPVGILDVHAHFLPPWYVDLARELGHERPDGMAAWPQFDVDTQLALMDERQFDRSLLSISSPGVALGSGVDVPALARRVNEHGAGLVSARPDRFGLLASLPLPDVDAALDELDYALDELGADGVILLTNADGIYLTDPRHEPLWAALARRECPVLLHPTSPAGATDTSLGFPRPMMEFLFDSTRVVLGLAMAGTFSRHPGLRLVIPHSGSLVPYLADRAALFQLGDRLALDPADPQHAVPAVGAQLENLWWDLAGTPTATHVGTLLARFGSDRIVYGSDSCFTPPPAIDLQLMLLDQTWAELGGDVPWRAQTRTNADRLVTRPHRP